MSTANAEVVTLDASLIAKLHNLNRELAFRDEQGNILGYYSPKGAARYVPPDEAPEVYAWIRSQIDEEELARRRREPGGRTTAEVVERLRGQ